MLFLFSEILPGHLEDTMGTKLCKELQKTKELPRICISCWKNFRIRIEPSLIRSVNLQVLSRMYTCDISADCSDRSS